MRAKNSVNLIVYFFILDFKKENDDVEYLGFNSMNDEGKKIAFLSLSEQS